MSSPTAKKHSAHPFRKRVIGLVLRVFLILLFLEFVIYFGSNLLLSGWAQRKINEVTKEVYLVDFDRLNFSLLRRGIFLTGLVMKPREGVVQLEDQVLFDFSLDQVGFSGLWFDFFDKEFTISKIYLDNPSIQMQLPPKAETQKEKNPGKKDISPVKLLENEIRKSVAKMNLAGFLIKEVEIDHANVFFFNFLSHGNLTAENTSLIVKNIDLTTFEEWKTPFNARGFEFELEKVTFPLPDGVHTILSDRVFISSLENLIDIKKFSLHSDRSKESKAYYDVDLEKLILGNVDLNKAFMTSELEVDELILNSPHFQVASNPNSKTDSTASGDLNDFIKGNLNSITIKELAINKGRFTKSQIEDTLKNRIELDELNFKMVQFYLGEDSVKRADQFFYGEDASMEIMGSKIYLGDEVHLLQGERVSVSSFKDELLVTNLSIAPRPGAKEEKNPSNLFQISLPEFALTQIDLKKLYNEGIFEVEEVLINQPKVEFIELTKSEKTSEKSSLSEVVAGFLNLAEVKKFEVREGEIQFKDERGQRSNDIGFDKFSFILEGLAIDPTPGLAIHDQFKTDEFFLSLDNYQLKLRDNLHLIQAGKLTVDSKNSLLEVQNLQIQPESQQQIQSLLDAYGKTSAIDFAVPLFRAEGIDIQSAFYDQILKIEKIILPKPEFSIATYKKKVKSESSVQSTDDVKSILLGYFDSIEIDSISMDQGKISYQSLADGKKTSFEEDNLALRLKNFSIFPGDSSFTGKTLFSEEIDLQLSNYSFSLAGGKYLAQTDLLKYNSKAESINFKNLILSPGESLESRIELGLNLPEVTFKGVDLEEFVFDNVLDLEKLEITGGKVEVAIDRKITSIKAESGSNKKVQRAIEWVKVDTIRAKDSFLQLSFSAENSALKSIETGFEFSILGFHMDTTMVKQGDLSKIYSSADLDLKNFVFALPDSVHTVSFSKVQLGDSRQEMVFSDLKVTPKDLFGKPGSPVIQASIDQLGIIKNRLLDIVSTKRFDLKEIRLVNPRVDIYLDTIKSSPSTKAPRSSNSQKKMVESMVLGDFRIDNGNFKVHRKGQGLIPRLDFQKLNLHAKELGIDVLDKTQEMNIQQLASKDLSFSLEDYHLLTPDSLYKVSFGKIGFGNGDLILDRIFYRPVKGNYAHLRDLPYQTDAVSAKIDQIKITGIDAPAYFEKNKILAEVLSISHAEVDLFRDKRHPIDTTVVKSMPQYLMSHAKISADIHALQVRDSRVRYIEFAPKGNLPGMIEFNDIQVDLAPLYLRKEGETYPVDKVNLGIAAKIMNESDVTLQSTMYFSEKYPMDVSVSMNQFNFAQANDFLSKTLFVKALDGTVSEGNWNFVINEEYALGKMAFGYSDLKVQFVDSLTYERGLGKLKIYSFGANLFAKNNNPRGASGKTFSSRIFQERDKRKFIFSAWWKATFSGLRGTFGLGQPKIPKWMRKDEEPTEE